jgi:pyruvate kinase
VKSVHLIKSTIASSIRKAVEELRIKLLICLTETGSTIPYFTGYNLGCSILAVCSDYRVARLLNGYKSVFTLCLGSLVGYESVLAR